MGVISKLYWMLRTGRDMKAVTPAALSPAIWCFQLDDGSFLTVRRKAQPLEEGPTITTLAVIGPVKDLSHRTRETLLGRYWQLQLAAVWAGLAATAAGGEGREAGANQDVGWAAAGRRALRMTGFGVDFPGFPGISSV